MLTFFDFLNSRQTFESRCEIVTVFKYFCKVLQAVKTCEENINASSEPAAFFV